MTRGPNPVIRPRASLIYGASRAGIRYSDMVWTTSTLAECSHNEMGPAFRSAITTSNTGDLQSDRVPWAWA